MQGRMKKRNVKTIGELVKKNNDSQNRENYTNRYVPKVVFEFANLTFLTITSNERDIIRTQSVQLIKSYG